MADVRPYKITDSQAIDMNLVTSMQIYEDSSKWIVYIQIYCTDPVVLEYTSKAKAKFDYNRIYTKWAEEYENKSLNNAE